MNIVDTGSISAELAPDLQQNLALEQLFSLKLPGNITDLTNLTWVSRAENVSPEALKIAQFVTARRVKFLEYLNLTYNPQRILYVGCGPDQLPSSIFGKKKMVNTSIPFDAENYRNWHPDEVLISTYFKNFDENVSGLFDLVYYHDGLPAVLWDGSEKMISRISPSGALVLDVDHVYSDQWQNEMNPAINNCFVHNPEVSLSALPFQFKDIFPEDIPISPDIRRSFTFSPQQCFRVFTRKKA